ERRNIAGPVHDDFLAGGSGNGDVTRRRIRGPAEHGQRSADREEDESENEAWIENAGLKSGIDSHSCVDPFLNWDWTETKLYSERCLQVGCLHFRNVRGHPASRRCPQSG